MTDKLAFSIVSSALYEVLPKVITIFLYANFL